MCSHHIVWWALQLPMSPCRLYCPTTLSHLPHCSCPHMIRCILLSDIPHVLVVSGTLDMTPCFLDMCVFLIRTWWLDCVCISFYISYSLYHSQHYLCTYIASAHQCHVNHKYWWILVHLTCHISRVTLGHTLRQNGRITLLVVEWQFLMETKMSFHMS